MLPRLARRVSSNPDAYTYLQETIDAWPDQPSLARIIARSGWTDVAWRNMTFGVVALHHADPPRRLTAAPRAGRKGSASDRRVGAAPGGSSGL